jgi:hypothetical protein
MSKYPEQRDWRHGLVVEHLRSKYEALSSNPRTTKTTAKHYLGIFLHYCKPFYLPKFVELEC